MAFDIPISTVHAVNDGDKEKKRQFVIQTGMLASALEHAVPEQLFADPNSAIQPDAVSAIKALSKASAAGQRIYHITQANQAAALSNINHDSGTMNKIRAALNAGKEVITHTDNISVPGWSGVGYIILDPVVGDGAYMISGGANGGWLFWATIAIILAVIAFFLVTILTGGLTLVTGIYGALAIKSYFDYLSDVNSANDFDNLNRASFLAWLRGGLGFLPVFKELGTLGKILVHMTNIIAAMISSTVK